MKKSILLFSLLAGILLSGCKRANLDELDKQAQLDLGLAVPLGYLHTTLNDFLGNGKVENLCLDADGLFHYVDTVYLDDKTYHSLDLSQYLSSKEQRFYVYDDLNALGLVHNDTVVGANVPVELHFPMVLELEGINKNLGDERIDSAHITSANFSSLINTMELGLKWEWINYVDMELGPEFTRSEGNLIRVYTQGDTRYNYNTDIPISIDKFVLTLMRDKTQEPSNLNCVDSCQFMFHFNFTIPMGEKVAVKPQSSSFAYKFQVRFIDYEAVWGYFQASTQMQDERTLVLDSLWDGWANFKRMKMRFMEPQITMEVEHRIAAPLRMFIDYIVASDSVGTRKNATWNGITHTDFPVDNVLSPYTDLNDSVWNSRLFNQEDSKGNLDEMFDLRPDTIKYSFHLWVDEQPRTDYLWKQHRITRRTDVRTRACMDMPMKINEESEAQLLTKIESLDFSSLSLDSLFQDVDIIEKAKAKELKLFMTLENGIPFDVEARVKFFGDSALTDTINLHFFDEQENDLIHMPAPEMERLSGEVYGRVKTRSSTTYIASIDENEFEELKRVKIMELDAQLTDNPQPCKLDSATDLRIHLGLAASLEALMDFEKSNQ